MKVKFSKKIHFIFLGVLVENVFDLKLKCSQEGKICKTDNGQKS